MAEFFAEFQRVLAMPRHDPFRIHNILPLVARSSQKNGAIAAALQPRERVPVQLKLGLVLAHHYISEVIREPSTIPSPVRSDHWLGSSGRHATLGA
ncbi:MAG: hypothetical protein JO227_18915 [Acetobacteraceae bacterium]|nr:hypothetical protein [Acetobacteraceae bacterium]